jgi:hypothetical protein
MAADFAPSGENEYFVLQPGHTLVLKGLDGGEKAKVVITVLDRTKVIDGVRTRVVREKEKVGGEIAEISWNYFAIDRRTGDVHYFGEDVDNYEDGRVVDHEGSWRAGRNGALPGIIMPGEPRVGQKYKQERAPGEAEDIGKVVADDDSFTTPAGTFTDVLKVKEWNPLEPDAEREVKRHAPGIGLVQDEGLKLVSYTPARS